MEHDGNTREKKKIQLPTLESTEQKMVLDRD